MVYGKDYKIIINFSEFDDQESFENKLIKLCKESSAVLFIDGEEIEI